MKLDPTAYLRLEAPHSLGTSASGASFATSSGDILEVTSYGPGLFRLRIGPTTRPDYGIVTGRVNLHYIWDGPLAERSISTPPGGASGILASISPAERAALAAGSVEDWSRESWEAARKYAYGTLVADPCATDAVPRPTMTEEDVQKLIPIVRRQVAAGGLRLARLLDDALGPGAKAPGQKDR
jgi:hypothetical protein